MNTHGAAVHDAFGTTSFRGLDDGTNGRRVDGAILLFAEAGLSVDGGDVVDDVNAVGRPLDGIGVREIAGDDLNAGRIYPKVCN
jgi:hypothetical protein